MGNAGRLPPSPPGRPLGVAKGASPPAPPVAPKVAAGPPPAAVPTGLSDEARAQVVALVRAAVLESVAPLERALREMSAKIEGLERRPVPLSSIPITAASLAPPAPLAIPALPALPVIGPRAEATAAPHAQAPAPPGANTFLEGGTSRSEWTLLGRDTTGLVLVSLAPPPPPLPGAELGSAVPPEFLEAFDGGRRRKRLKAFVVLVLLIAVSALVLMTILSHR